MVIANRAREDLRRAGAVAVDQHSHRHVIIFVVDLLLGHVAVLVLHGYDNALRQDQIRHFHAGIDQPAAVVAQVDNHAGNVRRPERVNRFGESFVSVAQEVEHHHIADVALQNFVFNIVDVDVFAHHVEIEGVQTAHHRHLDAFARRSAHDADGLLHLIGGIIHVVDVDDLIARANTRLFGRAALEHARHRNQQIRGVGEKLAADPGVHALGFLVELFHFLFRVIDAVYVADARRRRFPASRPRQRPHNSRLPQSETALPASDTADSFRIPPC